MIAAWAGSAIPRNSDWTEPTSGVEIMVETNGIHTAIVLPLVTVRRRDRTTSVLINGHHAPLWDGKPKYQTGHGYGH